MTKAELIEFLEEVPDDATFLVSSDEEGNSYRRANFSLEPAYLDGHGWEVIHPADVDEYADEELVTAVVFW